MKHIKSFKIFESDDPKARDRDMERTNWEQDYELNDFQELFRREIRKMGYEPNELAEMSEEERRDFFNTIDSKWESEKERRS